MKLHWVRPQGLVRRSVALGTFDGVHRGHRRLLEAATAKTPLGGASTVFTFDYPPEQIFTGHIRLLSDFSTRQDLIFASGIHEIVWAAFDQELALESPERFIRDVLLRALRVESVVCGFNFRFGHQGRGTPEMLADAGRQHGFGVDIIEPIVIDNAPVSSTRIRQCLLAGDVTGAARLLGRYPAYRGTITSGAGRGRILGFPTANAVIARELLLPRDSVYLTWNIDAAGRGYPGVTSISSNPTFAGGRRTVETHLLDFSGNLYDQLLTIQFLEWYRDIYRYPDAAALRRQIAADVDRARGQMQQFHLQAGQVVLE